MAALGASQFGILERAATSPGIGTRAYLLPSPAGHPAFHAPFSGGCVCKGANHCAVQSRDNARLSMQKSSHPVL
jgi:hypothetical protein